MSIPRSESKTVEFKTAFNKDVIETLVAFANAEGGNLYVGVRDDGRVVGVQLAAESETTWVNEIKSKTAPSIIPDVERLDVNGKTVVRFRIPPLPVKPTSVQGRYYMRKGKSNHLMSISELSELYLKSTSSSWDALAYDGSLEVRRGEAIKNGVLKEIMPSQIAEGTQWINSSYLPKKLQHLQHE